MKLIILSNPNLLDREVEMIHSLFQAGMETFHLRKPDWDQKAYKSFLHHINPKYHTKISIHAHHELANSFDLGGLHFTESAREKLGIEYIKNLKSNNLTISTSFHQLNQLENWDGVFDYAFLSPVFDSISKQGYDGVFQEGLAITNYTTKLIGLGGIHTENILKIKDFGFEGAAVLGSIWKQPKLAITNYLNLKELATCVPTY